MNNLLVIDEARTVAALEEHIRKVVAERGVDGVVMGLSGGIDSALVAALAVRVLGADAVHAAYLYDHHSARDIARNVRRVAAWLGLKLEERSIQPVMRDAGVYAAFGIGAAAVWSVSNRLFERTCRWMLGETPFVSNLRWLGTGAPLDGNFVKRWFQKIIRQAKTASAARHRYRREVLEEEARRNNRLLIGAGNRTEWLTGYFTRDGIDDVPIQPIVGLYKTQVRQLAAFLDMPARVVTQAPSGDMVKGITDELAMGVRYRKLDLILDHLAGGLDAETIRRAGCTDADVNLVRTMNHLSAWKRKPTGCDYAVDGGPGSALRARNQRPETGG